MFVRCYHLPIKCWKEFKEIIYSCGFIPREKSFQEKYVLMWDKTVTYGLPSSSGRSRIAKIHIEFLNKPRRARVEVISKDEKRIPKKILLYLEKHGHRDKEYEF